MSYRLALPMLLVSLSLAGCMRAAAESNGADAEDGTSAATSTSSDTGADTEAAADTTSDDVAAASDGSRPPAGGITGGRDTVRETLVVVQPLIIGPIRDEIVVSAKVEARVSVQVFPKLSNLPVTSVLVEEGEWVEEGQVLMELYDTELVLAEQTASAALDEARKQVEREELMLEQEEARIVREQREAQKTKQDLERLVGLGADGLVNAQEVDDARLAAETALDDIQLAGYVRDATRIALELATIDVRQAEIAWNRAKTDLEQTRVIAPLGGIVASRDVEIGELSKMSGPAFLIVDTTRPILNLRVPQDVLGRLEKGQRVTARAVTHRESTYEGVVRTVNPVLDAATGSVQVIVDLAPEPGLVPGLFCEARVITAARDEALLVDKRAVEYDDDQPYFFVVAEDGKSVRKVPFRAGARTSEFIEILGSEELALSGDVRVVVVGQESLNDGARVKVQEKPY